MSLKHLLREFTIVCVSSAILLLIFLAIPPELIIPIGPTWLILTAVLLVIITPMVVWAWVRLPIAGALGFILAAIGTFIVTITTTPPTSSLLPITAVLIAISLAMIFHVQQLNRKSNDNQSK